MLICAFVGKIKAVVVPQDAGSRTSLCHEWWAGAKQQTGQAHFQPPPWNATFKQRDRLTHKVAIVQEMGNTTMSFQFWHQTRNVGKIISISSYACAVWSKVGLGIYVLVTDEKKQRTQWTQLGFFCKGRLPPLRRTWGGNCRGGLTLGGLLRPGGWDGAGLEGLGGVWRLGSWLAECIYSSQWSCSISSSRCRVRGCRPSGPQRKNPAPNLKDESWNISAASKARL